MDVPGWAAGPGETHPSEEVVRRRLVASDWGQMQAALHAALQADRTIRLPLFDDRIVQLVPYEYSEASTDSMFPVFPDALAWGAYAYWDDGTWAGSAVIATTDQTSGSVSLLLFGYDEISVELSPAGAEVREQRPVRASSLHTGVDQEEGGAASSTSTAASSITPTAASQGEQSSVDSFAPSATAMSSSCGNFDVFFVLAGDLWATDRHGRLEPSDDDQDQAVDNTAKTIVGLNTAFASSGVPLCARLVGIGATSDVSYSVHEKANTGLLSFDGIVDDDAYTKLKTWADADAVLFVTREYAGSGGGRSGQANMPVYGRNDGFASDRSVWADEAYAWVRFSAPVYATWVHEIGHLLGAAHDPFSTSALIGDRPVVDYAYGYIDLGDSKKNRYAFRTIMAYDDLCGGVVCNLIPFFSDVDGFWVNPLGYPQSLGSANACKGSIRQLLGGCSTDNSRMLSESAPAAAAWGDPMVVNEFGISRDDPLFLPIRWMSRQGITEGCSQTSFCVDDPLSRGQFTVFLQETYEPGYSYWADPYYTTSNPLPFYDLIDGFWGRVSPTSNPTIFTEWQQRLVSAVAWAYKHGITSGTTSTTFDPNGGMLRFHVAAYMHRLHENANASNGLPGFEDEPYPWDNPGGLDPQPLAYSDLPLNWFGANEVAWGDRFGLWEHMVPTGNLFWPDNPAYSVTRGQMAFILWRDYAHHTARVNWTYFSEDDSLDSVRAIYGRGSGTPGTTPPVVP